MVDRFLGRSGRPAGAAAVTGSTATRLGRSLLVLAATSAGAAAVSTWGHSPGFDEPGRADQLWQSYGLLVFAGLFAILAFEPHRHLALWVLVTANKLALAVTGLLMASKATGPATVRSGRSLMAWDGGLGVLLITAFVCCRWPLISRHHLLGKDRPPAPRATTPSSRTTE